MRSKVLQKMVSITKQNADEIRRLDLNQLSVTGKKNDIDLQELVEFHNLETLGLRNFEINEKDVLNICNVKNLILINCVINVHQKINSNIKYLRMIRCDNVEHNILNEKLEMLELEDIDTLDIDELIKYSNLKELKIDCCKNIANLNNLSKLVSLERLSINEAEMDAINIDKMVKLKKINLDGVKMKNKENFIEYVKQKNIEISFANRNLPIE